MKGKSKIVLYLINNSTIIRTKDFIVLDTIGNSASVWRNLQQTLNQPFQYLFTQIPGSVGDWVKNYVTTFEPLTNDLPPVGD